jgi:hypothetical protein
MGSGWNLGGGKMSPRQPAGRRPYIKWHGTPNIDWEAQFRGCLSVLPASKSVFQSRASAAGAA